MSSTKEYSGKDIKVLSDHEHVRLRTSIYLGSTEMTTYEIPIFTNDNIEIKQKSFIPALFKSFNEISDNAIDELTQLTKKDKKITYHHDTITNRFKICDNGRGVPIDIHEQTNTYTPETVFTQLRSGRNFDDDAKDSGVIGTNGVGSSCVAMLSEEFHVQIKRDNTFYEQMYRDGTTVIETPMINTLKSKETGTCIEYKIDTSLPQFESIKIDHEMIENRVFEIAVNNPNLELSYSRKQLDDDGDEEQISKTFQFKGGMSEYLKRVSDSFFEFKYESEDFTAKYYIVLDKYRGIDEKIFVYVNSSLLFEGGTASHMFFNTFFSSVCDGLKKEAKKRKIELNKNDVKQNLLILADVKMKNPRYDNQSKTRLISQEIKKHIDKMISNQISKFLSSNKVWVSEILDRAEFRQRIADMTEVKKKQKKKGKLAKLIDCYTKDRNQATIVFSEGDCLVDNTSIICKDGIKVIKDIVIGEKLLTHTSEFKKVISTKSVQKRKYQIVYADEIIECSGGHKFPVWNIETEKIQLLKVKELDINRHKLLKKLA